MSCVRDRCHARYIFRSEVFLDNEMRGGETLAVNQLILRWSFPPDQLTLQANQDFALTLIFQSGTEEEADHQERIITAKQKTNAHNYLLY